jgi:hypothetical protein
MKFLFFFFFLFLNLHASNVDLYEKNCPNVYQPVCGEIEIDDPVHKMTILQIKSFSNRCFLNASKYHFIYQGECKKYTKDKNLPTLNSKK